MTFSQAFRVSMRKYAKFSGRSRRSEYWWFVLALVIISVPLQILMSIAIVVLFFPVWLEGASGEVSEVGVGDLWWAPLIVTLAVAMVVQLVFVVPYLAAQSRRLHDANLSGAFVWLNFVGLSIVPLIMCAMDSTVGENDYGPDPRDAS